MHFIDRTQDNCGAAMDAATERPTLISNTDKMRGAWEEERRSLAPASLSVAFTRGRDARGPENEGWCATFHFRLQRRARAKRDAISYSAGTDDLYMYKVTITILKTVLAGDKQLLTFLHL